MGTRIGCPKCEGPAYRVYSQVPKPTKGGKTLSTSVTLDAVFCGTASLRDGRGVLTVGPKQHGLVSVPHAAIVRAKRHATKASKAAKAPKAKKTRRHHPKASQGSGATGGPSANAPEGA